jgi:hypothetical protein
MPRFDLACRFGFGWMFACMDGPAAVAVLTNGEQSWESGMSVLNGDLSENFEDMCVIGIRHLQANDYLRCAPVDASISLCSIVFAVKGLFCAVLLLPTASGHMRSKTQTTLSLTMAGRSTSPS